MKSKMVQRIFLVLTLSLTGSGVMFYQGCGEMESNNGASSFCPISASTTPVDKNYDVLPGEQTVSIAYGRPLLDSMVMCTGIGSPSTRTLNEWETRNQTLSEYGMLTDVSGAMMMAITAIAGEVCRDLVDKEKPLAANQRGIFGGVANFAGSASLSSAEVNSAADMLGISCWQRLPTLEEKSVLTSTVNQIGGNADMSALTLCTSMLSSLAAIAQ